MSHQTVLTINRRTQESSPNGLADHSTM